MRIVHNYNLRYHIEKNNCALVKISHKLIVVAVGSFVAMAFKTKWVGSVSIPPHEATALLELVYLQTNAIV